VTSGNDDPTVGVKDGRIVYRASALGSCTKALVAARMGYDAIAPPSDAQQRMDEGHLHEMDVTRRMVEEGWRFSPGSSQLEVVLPITRKVVVVGHLDGLGWKNGPAAVSTADPIAALKIVGGHVVEIKSQSKNQWADFERSGWESGFFPKYKWQLSAYMLATGLPAVVVRKNRDNGQVKYEYVEAPFYSLTATRVRVMMVEALVAKGELPEECDNRVFPCPFFYLHHDPEVTTLEDPQLDELGRQYKEASVAEAAARQIKEDTRKALRQGLVGMDKVSTAIGTKITFYMAKNPPSLDKERMKADGIDLDSYMTQTESERLRVTLPKDGD
jgi:hypothetical protein